MHDPETQRILRSEDRRQRDTLTLIPSENYVSEDVLAALGSSMTNKYVEGYPSARYYAGNKYIDEVENLTKSRALATFDLRATEWMVNVQAYSGSGANLAVYIALVSPGETIMGLQLSAGGHLTHGSSVSVSGKLWKSVAYDVNPKTGMLDYAAIEKLAVETKPKLIVAGFTAYSRAVDFKAFRRIADRCGAYLLIDMSHLAGLIAGGAHASPFPYADIVTTTTHKTLRGPRSALIFSRSAEIGKKIDRAIFPGLQGGPHANQIAAVAVALKEAQHASFKKYAKQIVKNSRALADALKKDGWKIVAGGSDTNVLLVDLTGTGLTGKEASDLLEASGLVVNKNTVPGETRSPMDPSGIRLGTPALTSRGMKEVQMKQLARLIHKALKGRKSVKAEVLTLARRFPIPKQYVPSRKSR